MIVFFVDEDGLVKKAPLFEVQLDGLEDTDAIQILLTRGYTDEDLMAYLKGRAARIKHAENGG